jgi:hypothetical protein
LPGHDTFAAGEVQELMKWISTNGRKPLQILNPLTPEQHEERRLGKTLSKLRDKASKGLLPNGIASELDKVGQGQSAKVTNCFGFSVAYISDAQSGADIKYCSSRIVLVPVGSPGVG